MVYIIGMSFVHFPPPSSLLLTFILQVNSVSSLLSDILWAYSMLLTTPLVVTVGLSLTIPLSLVGQIVLQSQYASPLYWVGAAIVFLSFLVVNHESRESGTDSGQGGAEASAVPVDQGTTHYSAVPGDDMGDVDVNANANANANVDGSRG